MKSIILDTDIDTDCDDAGALAFLHGLANRGEARILGVICSIPLMCCAVCVQAMNEAYERPDVPVGLVRVDDWTTNPAHATYREHHGSDVVNKDFSLYNEQIANDYLARRPDWRPEEAVALYRRLLSEAPDGGVTICAIGTLTALSQLLASGPDIYSPLTGSELVKAKVSLLVSMALGSFPEGKDTFNWRMDLPAAADCINTWPTPLAISAHGETILTGARFMAAAPEGHPGARAYRVFLGGVDKSRCSWDQVATLYAARGADGVYDETRGHTIHLDPATGEHKWTPEAGGPERVFVQPSIADAELTTLVEDLMIAGLKR